MRLTLVKDKITQLAAAPGLLTGQIEYGVKEGKSNLKWVGPKIPADVWLQVLAFFRWTFKEHRAEGQVRLYVNAGRGTWAAWAYPQDAASYGATHEIANPEADRQREQFPDADGWLYIGTAHHHCGMNAFQSHTDKNNETNQDGLHITVGNLDKPRYDIHCRFYLSGCEFNPDMAEFWDVGNELVAVLPNSVLDFVARHQMTLPPLEPAQGVPEFPEQWKKNVDDYKKKEIHGVGFQNGNGGGSRADVSGSTGNGHGTGPRTHGAYTPPSLYPNAQEPFYIRKEHAFKMARGTCCSDGISKEAFDGMMDLLNNSDIVTNVLAAAKQHGVDILDVADEWDTQMTIAGDNGQTETGWEHLQQ